MSKWLSELTGLESKAQLKAHRQHRFSALKADTDLIFAQSYAYTTEERQLADDLWAQADEDYEARKVDLRSNLNTLSLDDKTKYFEEVGETERAVDDYLPVSPFVV